mmetsp:Transcript_13196/g.34380  ORF Transcript_13196/g.34380 Transcript_13196/m.34380 type:complete len:132 (+) Transcript_13196:17-412(+)
MAAFIALAVLCSLNAWPAGAATPAAAASRVLARTPRAYIIAAEGDPPHLLEVCRGRHCSKRGSAKTLTLLQELAPEGVSVVEADCSDTEHGCFDECTMGPNVRVDSKRIVNGVKGGAACAELLGVAPPEAS